MDRLRQTLYLQAMGIQVWHPHPSVFSVSSSITPDSMSTSTTDSSSAHDTHSEEMLPVEQTTEQVLSLTPTQSPAQPIENQQPLTALWETLQQKVIACTACELHKTRTQTVFGVGHHQATCMLVGEAPGADEDAQGEPFVGRAGKLLNAMLFAIQVPRESVYIANVLKCRPPNNRNPAHDEMARCTPFLRQQIDLVQPKLIVALGAIAAQYLLATTTSIGNLRGKRFTYADTGIPLIATYHPAYLLRSPQQKRKAWEDLQLIRRMMGS